MASSSSIFAKLAIGALTIADATLKETARQQEARRQAREDALERQELWAQTTAGQARSYSHPARAQVHTTVHTSRDLFGHQHQVVEQVVTLSPEQQELENMRNIVAQLRARQKIDNTRLHSDFFTHSKFDAADSAIDMWSMDLNSFNRKDRAKQAVRAAIRSME